MDDTATFLRRLKEASDAANRPAPPDGPTDEQLDAAYVDKVWDTLRQKSKTLVAAASQSIPGISLLEDGGMVLVGPKGRTRFVKGCGDRPVVVLSPDRIQEPDQHPELPRRAVWETVEPLIEDLVRGALYRCVRG